MFSGKFTALCILFLVIQLISTPTTHPLTLPTLPPLCHSYSHLIFFFLTKRVREYAGCQLQEGLGFPADEGKFPFAAHDTKSCLGIQAKFIHKPKLKTLT